MSKIIDLQYNLANGENIQYIHADEYVAIRRDIDSNQYIIHSQIRYGAELENNLIEAIIEPDTAKSIEYLQINTIGGNQEEEYPLNLADLTDCHFPNLRSLLIPEQFFYKRTYIYDGFDETKENGIISGILKECPSLTTLTLPTTPDNNFLDVELLELESLQVIDRVNPDKILNLLSKMSYRKLPSLLELKVSKMATQNVVENFLNSPIGKRVNLIQTR